jgi:hypothetical protein
LNQIEVVSSGFTFEELHHLKRLFLRIRDRLVVDGEIPKISVAIDPLDKNFMACIRYETPRGLDVSGARAQSAATADLVSATSKVHLPDYLCRLDQRSSRFSPQESARLTSFDRQGGRRSLQLSKKTPRAIFKSGRLWHGYLKQSRKDLGW